MDGQKKRKREAKNFHSELLSLNFEPYPVISSMEFFMRQRPFFCTHAELRTIEKQKPDKSGKGMALVLD
ncbi:hypothetical protein AK812_SmicGene14981 [Symbiodinium microadriaticum]|uniref:Uncharacterized protein n=1 Tax=Symbiodinium microadriaticum TaxID=2951 RepID=A0A1Q9E420_SYMMI|nr:hypothetical protein AK812_SmicGene14981 [Symbiodinium microadriaticum]